MIFIRNFRLMIAVGITSMSSSAVCAYDLAAARQSEPRASFSTGASISDVERCILMMDNPDPPMFYRATDKLDESLVYWPTAFRKPMVVEISRKGDTTLFTVKNPVAKGAERAFSVCATK